MGKADYWKDGDYNARSWNVLPCAPAFYAADSGLGNSVFPPDFFLRSLICAYGSNGVFGKFGARMLDAFWLVATTFALSVLCIIQIGTNKQMVRIAARRTVAGVKNAKAARNLAAIGDPCEPMRKQSRVVEKCLAVAKCICANHPNPTTGFSDSLNALLDVRLRAKVLALVLWSHGTSNKGKGPVSRVGRAGPLSLFPVAESLA